MKPYDIEIQRLKSLQHSKGLLEICMDAYVTPRQSRDDESPAGSCLRLSVDDARTLQLLLRQQLTALDKLQPRSRRSGRA